MTAEIPPASFNRPRAIVFGGLGGGVMALGLIAWVSGRFALESVSLVSDEPAYVISTGAAYTAVIVFSALAGLLVAAFTYAQRTTVEPDAARYPVRFIMPMAAAAAVIVGYGVFRLGVELAGDVLAGVITVGVGPMVIVVLSAGLIAGAITTAVVDTLAHPAFINVAADEIPATPGEMFADMFRSVGAPIVGVVGAAAFAILLSQLLLFIEGNLAVAVFSAVAALVLGGATLIALQPWDRQTHRE